MNKYLFLDIDGVLNSERSVAAYGRLTHAGRVKQDMVTGKTPEPMWDEMAVGLLRTAQEMIGFKIVISSTWRRTFSLQDFHAIFDLYGWDTRGIIVGKTGENIGCRGEQIKAWLNCHATYPYHYCIIDDDSDMLEHQEDFFVKTNFRNGLSYECFLKIFEVFGTKYVQVGTLGLGLDELVTT
jgi:hypothetical protein